MLRGICDRYPNYLAVWCLSAGETNDIVSCGCEWCKRTVCDNKIDNRSREIHAFRCETVNSGCARFGDAILGGQDGFGRKIIPGFLGRSVVQFKREIERPRVPREYGYRHFACENEIIDGKVSRVLDHEEWFVGVIGNKRRRYGHTDKGTKFYVCRCEPYERN